MNQEILNKLKHASELSPDEHDGSYELVRTIVSAYRDVDEAVLDYHDLNAIYLMCIGTWRHSYDKNTKQSTQHICPRYASKNWIT